MCGPRCNEIGDIIRISWLGEQVVRIGEGDERFGMGERRVYVSRILQRDDVILWGMHNERGDSIELIEAFFLIMSGEIIEKALAYGESPACEFDVGLSFFLNLWQVILEEVRDVRGISRGANGGNSFYRGDVFCGG